MIRTVDPALEEKIRQQARDPDVYRKIIESTAPSIFGSDGTVALTNIVDKHVSSLFYRVSNVSQRADIKKAVACLLFGGSTKILPDGMRLRGDINVLLLGDPGTAKSQMLKFAEQVRFRYCHTLSRGITVVTVYQVAPIGVYTSGKGSSAAGLTASVIRDAASVGYHDNFDMT